MKIAEEAKFKQDLSVICRRASKALVNALGGEGKLLEVFTQNDPHEAGLINTTDAVSLILKAVPRDVKKADLNILLKELNISASNLFCYHSLARKIADLGQENASVAAVLRRLSSACTRKGAPLNNPSGFRQGFIGADKDGKIAASKFRAHLQSIIPGISEEEFVGLEAAFRAKESGKVDLKSFVDELFSPELRKPMLSATSEFKKTKKEAQLEKTVGSIPTQQPLKGKLEELKKENEYLKKENNALNQRIAVLEKEQPGPKIDFSKPVNQSKVEIAVGANQYSAKVSELEHANYDLMKKIDTEYKPQIARYKSEIEKLKADTKFLKLDNLKLESQIEKMLKKPMDGVERRHELEYLKDTKISEQQKKIQELTQEVQRLEEKVFALEQGKLELQFEKENFDLERSRLERRIKDLEQFQAEGKS